MHKSFTLFFLLATFVLTAMPATAQSDTASSSSSLNIGKANISWNRPSKGTPTGVILSGQVKMTSENYDLSCETLTLVLDKPHGKAKTSSPGRTFRKITAVGSQTAGTQVIADIRRPLESQAFHIVADLAVYTPDPTRPGGVNLNFTGHVVITTASGFLAEPSVTTTDYAILRLGTGDDYPQLETGPGHVTVTPAQ